MLVTWIAGACTLIVASFVFGLTGFGIGLVSLAILPFLLLFSPSTQTKLFRPRIVGLPINSTPLQ